MYFRALCVAAVLASYLGVALSHAIFWEPPSRASLGKHNHNHCNVPIDYDLNQLYCGGLTVMHVQNHGKCGICGDPYDAVDKPHEVPGKFATGTIGRSYFTPGQVINVIIDVVANHFGFFAFKLCKNDNPNKDPQQDCFDQHPLKLANGSDHYILPPPSGQNTRLEMQLRLPAGLTCWQCILQWTYVTGNSWGIGPQTIEYATENCLKDKDGEMGCGPQETFRGCADICIGPGCPTTDCQKARPFGPLPPPSAPTPTPPPTSPSSPTSPPSPRPPTTIEPDEDAPLGPPTSPRPPPAGLPPTPPPAQQLCIQSGIKPQWYSAIGNHYCEVTCLFQQSYLCNLFLCYCNTKWYVEVPPGKDAVDDINEDEAGKESLEEALKKDIMKALGANENIFEDNDVNIASAQKKTH